MAKRTREEEEDTTEDETSKELTTMEEQKGIIAAISKRTELVETRLTIVETKLPYYDAALAKQETFNDRVSTVIASIPVQLEATNSYIKAVEKRTDEHNATLASLTKENVDTGKILEAVKGRVNVLWGVSASLATIIVGYFVTHYVHF